MVFSQKKGLYEILSVRNIGIILVLFFVFFSSTSSFINANSSPAGAEQESTRARAYDYTLKFYSTNLVIDPGGSGVAELELDNKGESDTYRLTLENPPSGWLTVFENGKNTYEATVSSGSYKIIHIYIDAPKTGSMTLSATCRSLTTDNSKNAQSFLEAKYVLRLALVGISNVHSVEAGANTNFLLNITNYQDIDDTVTFTLDNKFVKLQNYADQVDWSAAFDNSSINMLAKETKFVTLWVYAPIGGNPGDKITIVVEATIKSSSQKFKSPDLISEIPKIYNITYSIKQDTPTTLNLPNSTINYTLKLFNSGNIDITISLRIHENPENWLILFYLDDELKTPEDLTIKIGKMLEFRVEVKIPNNANAGTHKILYGVYRKELSEKPLTEVNIFTNVSLKSDLDIMLPKDVGLINAELGKTTTTTVILHNKGNGKDTLNISIIKHTIPTGWVIYFKSVSNVDAEPNATEVVDFGKPIKLSYIEPIEYKPTVNDNYENLNLVMDANKKAYINLAISTPTTGYPATESITIYGESVSGTITIATITKNLEVKLITSNLAITEINVTPANPLPGEKVNVDVYVKNNFHLSANDFTVRISRLTTETGSTELDSKKIVQLAPNSTEVVEFSWTEPDDISGSYIIEVDITGDLISPTTKVTRTKNVILGVPDKKEGTSDNFSTVIIFLIIAIIIAVVIFLIIWLIFTRRTPNQPEPKYDSYKSKQRPDTRPGSKSNGTKGIKDHGEMSKSTDIKSKVKGSSSKGSDSTKKKTIR